jgi:hypothetical protein
LGDGTAERLTISAATAGHALIECVRHSFLLDVQERQRLALHFEQVTKLAKQPIHFILDYPRCFDELPRITQAIVEHASSSS